MKFSIREALIALISSSDENTIQANENFKEHLRIITELEDRVSNLEKAIDENKVF